MCVGVCVRVRVSVSVMVCVCVHLFQVDNIWLQLYGKVIRIGDIQDLRAFLIDLHQLYKLEDLFSVCSTNIETYSHLSRKCIKVQEL